MAPIMHSRLAFSWFLSVSVFLFGERVSSSTSFVPPFFIASIKDMADEAGLDAVEDNAIIRLVDADGKAYEVTRKQAFISKFVKNALELGLFAPSLLRLK